MSELILGTAQLGARYGIANRTGQPDAATARAIVTTAWKRGIHGFDTAPSYGASELLLGEALRALDAIEKARIVTKLDAIADGDGIHAQLAASRERLGVPALDAVLVRRTLLPEWRRIVPALRMASADGFVRAIGVSVYQPEEALAAMALSDVRVIQLPANALDRRFEAAGVFTAAASHGVLIHIRSAFLQGLLLMSPTDVPSHLAGARVTVQALHEVAAAQGMSPLSLALGVLRRRYPNADVVAGAETPAQVVEIVDAWSIDVSDVALAMVDALAAHTPAELLDPSRWPVAA